MGIFSVLSIIIAITFRPYGLIKSYVVEDSIHTVAIETILLAPFAIVFFVQVRILEEARTPLFPRGYFLFFI